MENLKRLLAILTVVAMLFVVGGVAEEAGEEAPVEGALALDQTSVTMDYSQTVTLTAANGGESARWTSSDEGVARLSANRGESVEVVGIAAGTATISCTAGEQQQSCEVTVTAPGTLEIVNVDYPSTYRMAGRGWKLRRGVLASNVDLATLTTVLKDANGTVIGSAYTHTFESGVRRYEISGLDNYVPFSWIGAEGAYTWTLSATDVSGRMVAVNLPINAVEEGETAITNDPGAQSPIIVVTEIALDSAEIEMLKDETRQLTATVTPGEAMNSGVIWVSDDPSVVVVSADGLVTGVGIGTATITCKTLGNPGISASCAVTVLAEPATEEGEAGTPGDGRNLISGTATPVELAPRNSGEKGDNYNFATYTVAAGKLEQGATYTVSADVEITAGAYDELSIRFYNAAIDTQQAENASFAIVDGHVTATVKITGTDAERMLIYAGRAGETRGNGIRITNLKLEKGNIPTEWSPAPEDGVE